MRRSDCGNASRLRPLAACLALACSANLLASPESTQGAARSTPHVAKAASDFAALSSAFAAFNDAFPTQPTVTLTVKNCDDHGPDSLREAIASATDGATIAFDMNAMACSTITLTTGQIDIPVDNLRIDGPGDDLLMVDGGYSSGYYNRIFNHPNPNGFGTLEIADLTLTDSTYKSYATAPQAARGGCVYSHGTLRLEGTTITGCHVLSLVSSRARGGGVSSAYSLEMVDSRVSNCIVFSAGGSANGGGIDVGGLGNSNFSAKYSSIENNVAMSQSADGRGGGIFVKADTVQIHHTTVSGNHADWAGGIYSVHAIVLGNSTIAENVARRSGGAEVYGNTTLNNSTIVGNTATEFGGTAGLKSTSLESNSSILANNITDDGISTVETDAKVGNGAAAVTGSHNLIMAAAATVPMDTISSCPRLGPLLDNGGFTHTHALLPYSPAIDAGSNDQNLDTDQRGSGFYRIVGVDADIGAYEWDEGSGDVINMGGFEVCE